MPSFDFANKPDMQLVDNTINIVRKEVLNRFDFKDSHVSINLDKKDYKIVIETESDMKDNQVMDLLISRAMKQGLSAKVFDHSEKPFQSGKVFKRVVKVRHGLTKEEAKEIVQHIKNSGAKVQAAIQGEVVRVSGKKIDDLQHVIKLSKSWDLETPVEVTNLMN